jgi:hypothetical protein
MGQRPSWPENNSSVSQEFSINLWNPKLLVGVYKNMSSVPVLSQINPVQNPNRISEGPFQYCPPIYA